MNTLSPSRLSLLLGDVPFWKKVLRLGIPIAVQYFLSSSFSLIDTMMVSQLGGNELSAVGMAGQWSWIFVTLLFGFSSGASILFSQYWGAKNEKAIRHVVTMAMAGSLVSLLPFFLAPLISPEFVMSLFNNDPAVISAGSRYLRIVVWSYPGIALNGIFAAALRSTEHVKIPMVSSFASMVMNAALNYCLIFGLGSVPAMGVEGAAIATVVSSWVSPLLSILIAAIQKNFLCQTLRGYFGFTRTEFSYAMRRIMPVVGNELLYGLASLTLTLIYSNLGTDEYGAVTILNSVSNVALAFCQGLGNACCIMVGKQVGAGLIREAVRDAKRFSILMPLFSFLLGLVIVVLRTPLISLFDYSGGLSDVTLATTYAILLFYGCEIALRNVPYVQVVGVLRAGGNVMAATVFDLICLWGLAIPAAGLAAYFGLPFLHVFMIAYLCEDLPKTILCLIWFVKEKWLRPVTEEGKAGLARYLEEKGKARCERHTSIKGEKR